MIRFTFDKVLLLNANDHRFAHWSHRARCSRALRAMAGWHGLAAPATDRPATFPVRAVVTFHFPDRRRRDAANLSPTTKPIVDGLVDAKLLPDDSTTYLTGADPRIGHDPTLEPGMVAVTVEFEGGAR